MIHKAEDRKMSKEIKNLNNFLITDVAGFRPKSAGNGVEWGIL